MDKITVDERNKKRIQRHIKQEIAFYGGYEQDVELLEQSGQLTEALAMKVFIDVLNDAHRIRTILEPEENDEFQDLMDEVYAKYDAIPKPRDLEEYGHYDGLRINMDFNEVYANMQTAFEVKELDTKYYACKDLRDIANTVINSIDGIEKYKIELQPESKKELQTIQEELRKLLNAKKTDVQAIQEKVDIYNEHATNIWNDYLTGIDNVADNQYRWVIHNLTKGELQGDFRDKYMSTSLITNKTMGVYGRTNYGLIIKPNHIVSASYKDSYTLNTRDDEENLFNIRRPPLMLPQEIENICIQQTISANGEMLNYEKAPIYSELVVDEYEIEGMYYISNGEQEFAPNYDVAKKMAEERGLPLIERDISKYRAELGLEPMTEIARKSLCRNILRKCCAGDKELELLYSNFSKSFVSKHFEEFYQRFIQLKENPEYTKEDILKVFADVARGDIDFDQISQNIDEMYMSDEERQTLHIETEYGLANINDEVNLRKRLEKIVSDGINYGANKEDVKGMKRFADIKRIMPQFETFKSVYLKLREMGIEEQLYIGMDFSTISYDEILEKATRIVEENENAIQNHTDDKNAHQEKIVESSIEIPEEIIGQPLAEKIEIDNGTCRINEFEEIIRTEQEQQNIRMDNAIPIFTPPNETQQVEQYNQQSENNADDKSKQIQEVDNSAVELWTNRFDNWYTAIDRVSQNVKAKFVKMKSDIVNAISTKIKERMNKREINTQEQDSSER
jgi:hypothetical protein